MNKIHPLAEVQSPSVGEGTFVWQYSIILEDAVIGTNCNINCHVFIENDVIIGNNVTVKPGVQIWDGLRIEDDVFIGPNVTFTNDPFPRSKQYQKNVQRTLICKGVSIGANATILGGVTVGENSMIGAGSVVTKNIPSNELWVGNPARKVKNISND
ncbi:acyltransferase [Kaistella polysaccharea]|uniref:acyltransferase n=1 Tax=Kaistella polysaccharea TaxID=2878534 RepID=UPI001CF3C733|nr:acyltransferase [Kaistella polysaccharea]